MPRTGDYNHLVDVLGYVTTVDAIGSSKRGWSVAFRLHCAIEHQYKAGDYYSKPANVMVSDSAVWFRTRNGRLARGVTKNMRIGHGGKAYRIVDIQDETGRNRELRFLCQEAVE